MNICILFPLNSSSSDAFMFFFMSNAWILSFDSKMTCGCDSILFLGQKWPICNWLCDVGYDESTLVNFVQVITQTLEIQLEKYFDIFWWNEHQNRICCWNSFHYRRSLKFEIKIQISKGIEKNESNSRIHHSAMNCKWFKRF